MNFSIYAHTKVGSDNVASLENGPLLALVGKLAIIAAGIESEANPAQYFIDKLDGFFGRDVTHTQSTAYRWEWDKASQTFKRICYDDVKSSFYAGTTDELVATLGIGTEITAPTSTPSSGTARVAEGEIFTS